MSLAPPPDHSPRARSQTLALSPQIAADGLDETVWADVLSTIDRTYSELVTQQQLLEDRNTELERVRGFLSSVLDHMSDVLIVCDAAGLVVEDNAALRTLRGAGVGADTPVPVLFRASDRPALGAALSRVAARGKTERLDAVLQSAAPSAGTPQGAPLELVISARRDRRGRHVGAVLIGRPVGELRRAYDELRQAQDRLVQNEKLASVGRLVAGVAHELNNPISFVYGSAHAMERYVGRLETYFAAVRDGAPRDDLAALRARLRIDHSVSQLRVAIEGAAEGAERVRDIVAALSRLSAAGTGEMAVVDLRKVAETAARWVSKSAGAPVDLRITGQAMAHGRAEQLQQVALNLIQNAVDAAPGGNVAISVWNDGDAAYLSVEDDGPGIAPGHLRQVFDPFFTTKPVGQGTGLGLSISLKIAEEHGGHLTAANRAQGGAVFTLEVPADPPGQTGQGAPDPCADPQSDPQPAPDGPRGADV